MKQEIYILPVMIIQRKHSTFLLVELIRKVTTAPMMERIVVFGKLTIDHRLDLTDLWAGN